MKNPNTHNIQELYNKYGNSTFTWSGIKNYFDSTNAVVFRFRDNTNTKNQNIDVKVILND